jgi:hypothetical protein
MRNSRFEAINIEEIEALKVQETEMLKSALKGKKSKTPMTVNAEKKLLSKVKSQAIVGGTSKIYPDGADNIAIDYLTILNYGRNLRKELRTPISAFSEDMMNSAITDLINFCADHKINFNINTICTYLGITRGTLFARANGEIRTDFQEYIQSLLTMIHAMKEGLAEESKINPVVHIFNAKNYYGMKDGYTNTLTVTNKDQARVKMLVEAMPEE